MFHLSAEYEATYNRMLEEVGRNSSISEEFLSLFWPMRGHQYEGDLFVIGRRPNGTDVNPNKKDLQNGKRKELITEVRRFAEPKKDCPMLWLTDPQRYEWKRSKFFRVAERVSLRNNITLDLKRNAEWASWICYSNLLKVAPAKPPDKETPEPSKTLKGTQLRYGIELIRLEVEAFCPRHVLVLTGKDWFSDFADGLGLTIKWREGLVEGTAMQNQRRWIIAKHPDIRSKGASIDGFVDEILKAFVGISRE